LKTIANRLIVFAVSSIALGTMAFGQTRMTAEIPFAFRTVNGDLPAGNPMYNAYRIATDAPVVEFLCGASGCALKALRTSEGSLEYAVRHKVSGEPL
jgi:hypothetical protein